MTLEYTTVRLLKPCYHLLKIEAAKRGVRLSALLDTAIRAEVKNGKNKRVKTD